MSEGDLHSLRIVIQQLSASANSAYRVVVYGDSEHPKHCDFDSAQILLETLCSAIPSFDLSKLPLNPLGAGQGSIVYTGEMKLNRSQLIQLGLS